jgi:3'-phosphoadenosine 5'-phosphosulfate sulfotransferase (PAPS reductase)/FAD synthetase
VPATTPGTALVLSRTTLDPFDRSVLVPDLTVYDVIIVNSSAGKDSEAMLAWLVELCDAQGVPRDRLVVVYADLGRVVHPGTRELAWAQARHFGLRFVVVARREDLLAQIGARAQRLREQGKADQTPWPSNNARYCTSDQKTSQVAKFMTKVVDEHRAAGHAGPVRILNCLGIRAEESPARAKKAPFGYDPANWSQAPVAARAASPARPARGARPARPATPAVPGRPGVQHSKRIVHRWLPIFDWSTPRVWQQIGRHGLPWHPAYRRLSRLSCVFCVLAGRRELTVAAQMYPELAGEYAALERRVGHPFKESVSMAQLMADAEDDQPDGLALFELPATGPLGELPAGAWTPEQAEPVPADDPDRPRTGCGQPSLFDALDEVA